MADLTTVTDFPPWAIDYQYNESNTIVRTADRGYKRQGRFSQKQVVIVDSVRRLTYSHLPFFESFVKTQADYGKEAFTDKYKDGNGVQTGLVRIVDGAYRVQTNGKNHTVSCRLEIM